MKYNFNAAVIFFKVIYFYIKGERSDLYSTHGTEDELVVQGKSIIQKSFETYSEEKKLEAEEEGEILFSHGVLEEALEVSYVALRSSNATTSLEIMLELGFYKRTRTTNFPKIMLLDVVDIDLCSRITPAERIPTI